MIIGASSLTNAFLGGGGGGGISISTSSSSKSGVCTRFMDDVEQGDEGIYGGRKRRRRSRIRIGDDSFLAAAATTTGSGHQNWERGSNRGGMSGESSIFIYLILPYLFYLHRCMYIIAMRLVDTDRDS